jgi:hypothetical protein
MIVTLLAARSMADVCRSSDADNLSPVMPALVAGIHDLLFRASKTWMAGSSPAMTV